MGRLAWVVILLLAAIGCTLSPAAERTAPAATETLWGVLEKTAKPGACAQITDTLAQTYYIAKTEAAEKAVAPYLGKNIRVVVKAKVDPESGADNFMQLESVERYTPKTKDGSAPPQKSADQ